MTYKVQLTNQANQDLQTTYNYIAEEMFAPEAADAWLEQIGKAISGLSQMPERFRKYESKRWNDRNLRVMPLKKYLIFYLVDNDNQTVTVYPYSVRRAGY